MLLLLILICALALYLLVRTSKTRLGPHPKPDETHYLHAADGVRLALHRYRPQGDNPHAEPVLLHHGFTGAADCFDMGLSQPGRPVPSLARWLAAQGYDVYACDLRGRAGSEQPRLGGKMKWDWSVDDYILRDDPAFLDHILEHSPYKNMHWVGLSMGGILLLCHCGLHGSPKLASGAALGSGLDYTDTGSSYQGEVKFAWLLNYIKHIPLGTFSKLFAPLCGRWGFTLERFNYHPANMAPQAQRAVYGGLINDVPSNEAKQLASMFEHPGFRSIDGATKYVELADNIKTPILLVHGTKDMQAPPALGERNLKMLGNAPHKLVVVGREHGQAEDYGHIDMVNGMRADTEVFPRILEWLRAHPATRK